ncbi:hypothetical protein AB0O31_31445, partial [Kitasatospora cineracea]|uniref:hypothetical protein n=1 Tax=Kitasatospora cineracea TaxID=88074 RepID=UPI00342F33C2
VTFAGSAFTDGAADVPPPPPLLHAVSTTMEAATTTGHPLRISLILHTDFHWLVEAATGDRRRRSGLLAA